MTKMTIQEAAVLGLDDEQFKAVAWACEYTTQQIERYSRPDDTLRGTNPGPVTMDDGV